ncbi:MAG TPA: hypothetical protein VFC60_00185 [Tissierellaceae bacterium]|nr:hypothetical protein [Tissierellaceae bacterium]
MKKIIILIISCLILTSCSNTAGLNNNLNALVEDVTDTYTEGQTTYIDDEMKETIDEINNLRDKYKLSLDELEIKTIYIDIYDKDNRRGNTQDTFTLNNIHGGYIKEYFDDIVKILDKKEAIGLKNYINKAYDMNLQPNEQYIKKIGRSVIHVENRGGDETNYIAIKTKLTNIKDEDYKAIFEKISRDKYILDNVVSEQKLDSPAIDPLSSDLISFVNDELFMNPVNSKSVEIRYELLLKDKDIDKVNILLSRRHDEKLKKEDIEVFINLLNVLDIKEADRGKLLQGYRNIFEEKIDKSLLDIEGYRIYVKYNKGNNYIGDRKENIYIAIEKK